MYIINHKAISKNREFICNRILARWLIYKKNLPVLSIDKGAWYFAKTEELLSALKEVPLWLSVLSKF